MTYFVKTALYRKTTHVKGFAILVKWHLVNKTNNIR